MSNVSVVGLQWGDEGKGKIVDALSENADAVIRFQGGHNAGHTLKVDGKTQILHLIPSGALYPDTECIIGSGVVVSIPALIEELEALLAAGINMQPRLKISVLCPLVFGTHCQLDVAREAMMKGQPIGTTGKGIGPAYEDKAGRRALRIQHLMDPKSLADKMEQLFEYHSFILEHYYRQPPMDWRVDYDFIMQHHQTIMTMLCSVPERLEELYQADKNLLFEGAQGAMLDIDHGTYPFVTSSQTIAGHISCGAGFPARLIDRSVGVCKAYATRVGNGPFPTETEEAAGQHMAERGAEFGATTGRPRRCGWLDLVMLKKSIWLNGIDVLCLTKLDVLTGLECIKVCTAYAGDALSGDGVPEYVEFEGWNESISDVKDYNDLPHAMQAYIEYIEKQVGISVGVISTGPGREANIIRVPIFE